MEVLIIGGGPAGYEAALHGAKAGALVTLIEDHKIGGTCLNYGCIPTKTLIEHATFYQKVRSGHDKGVQIGQATLHYDQVVQHKNEVVEQLCDGIAGKLKKSKVRVVEGYGKPLSSHAVEVTKEDGTIELIEGDVVILATGSKPIIPEFTGVHHPCVLTSKSLLALEILPESITIVGGGVIGMEFAALLNDFGVQVHVLEYAKNILPTIDAGISKRLKTICSKNGIGITTEAKVIGFEEVEGQLKTFYEGKKGTEDIISDKVLLSIGRIGRFDEQVCAELNIQNNQRFIQVDDHYETTHKGIYAIGDVNGQSLLAHAAYDQGRQLMDYLLYSMPVEQREIPGCIFTSPEIGTVGMSEEQVKELNIPYQCEKTLFSASGKALAMGETAGFIKTIVNEKGRLIGLHVMGPHASDLLHYGSIAIAQKMDIKALKAIIFAHPTLGELFSDNIHQYA